jgi:hypothetical protein
MKKVDKKLYKELTSILDRIGEPLPDKRKVVDMVDGFIFYFPGSGKVLYKKNGHMLTVYRNKKECWMLRPEIEEIISNLIKQ